MFVKASDIYEKMKEILRIFCEHCMLFCNNKIKSGILNSLHTRTHMHAHIRADTHTHTLPYTSLAHVHRGIITFYSNSIFTHPG